MRLQPMSKPSLSRRDFLRAALLVPASALLAACARALGLETPTLPGTQAPLPPSTQAPLPPTPACGDDDDDETTLAQTEGPFYTPDTPQRNSLLEDGMQGVYLRVTGQVLSTDCQPVAGALLDFWHADADGVYDNDGFRLRGHQFADSQGRYQLETILPGLYTGRTRHIHVKVQAPDGPILTTQLYFPDEPANAGDGIYDERLVMKMQAAKNGVHGVFNFVVAG